MEEMIEIKKSTYDKLIEKAFWLDCLEAAGVSSWDGCDAACEIKKEWESEE